ncbi:redox-regulated ATPase YchF [candidate division KSB1 bacterium]
MALKCGIVGLANTGKTTLFNCMSNTRAQTTNYAFSSNKSNIGMVLVPDQRLVELEKFQTTEKVIPTTVEIADIPGLAKGSSRGEGVGNQFLADIRQTDAIIHILRCFDDENLPHIEGSVDPVRDIEILELELQVKDLESVEKKMLRMEKVAKSGDKEAQKALNALKLYRDHFESFQSARTIKVDKDQQQHVADLFLLTEKPVIYVCNVDEASALKGNHHVDKVTYFLKDQETEILVIAGNLEAEISELEDNNDQLAFLQDYGLTEPGVNKLIRAAYKLLKLNTFFTVGPKEIRAWTIRKGMTAPKAAGVIHSDLERGFIRAEVMKYNDFVNLGSEHACKEAGKLAVEGKNYIVQDGDILHIRFNV